MIEQFRDEIFEQLNEELCFYLLDNNEIDLFFDIVEFVRGRMKQGVKLKIDQVKFVLCVVKKKKELEPILQKKIGYMSKKQKEYYHL